MGEERLPLHRAYRPQELDDIYGNEALIASLKSVLSRKDGIPTTFLFSGPHGCGKTTLARILAKELGAVGPRNLKELNISNTRGIDAARKIIDNVSVPPLGGGNKVIILNECHRSTIDFQNAMLEVLEEPPKNTYFILCTTEPQSLLPPVRSRCHTYEVSKLISRQMRELIRDVLENEGVDDFPDSAINAVVKAAGGHPRQALVILDSVIDLEDEDEILQAIKEFVFDESSTLDLCRKLLNSNNWKEISKLLGGVKDDPERVRLAVLGYMSKVLLSGKKNDRASDIIIAFEDSFISSGVAGLVNACYLLCG